MNYNTDLYNPLSSYGATTAVTADALGMPQTAVAGAVATAVDIGTTFWNSLAPDSMSVETEELLGRISDDALAVYNENPDTIKTLSFVGGLLVPAGFAFKGMDALRKGSKGVNWFTTAGRDQRLARAEEAFAKGGPNNDAFIKAKWDMYRGVAANALVDNAVAEAAILLTMSAHPYLEDYTKNFGTNFAIGTLFGASIQTTLGAIVTKSDILARVNPIAKEGATILMDTLVKPEAKAGIRTLSYVGERTALRANNLDNLRDIIAKAEDVDMPEFTLAPFTVNTLKRVADREEALLYKGLTEAAEGDLAAVLEKSPAIAKEHILNFVARVENAGLDKISFANAVDKYTPTKGSGTLGDTPTLWKYVKDKVTGEQKKSSTKAYWSPVFEKYFGASDSANYLTIADIGSTIEALEKSAIKEFQIYGRRDISFELGVTPSAFVDAEYAKAYLAVKSMDFAQLNKIKSIDPEDLPYLKAIYTRVQELQQAGSTGSLKLKITKEAPSFEAITRSILKQKGMSPDYGRHLNDLEKNWDNYSMYHPKRGSPGDVDSSLSRTISQWIGGSKGFLRGGAEDYLKGIDSPASRAIAALRNHPRSIAQREIFQQMADEDNHVWVYRGLKQEPGLHPSLESYTLTASKAAEFIGKGSNQYTKGVKMFRVNVDDIVTGFRDIPEYGGSVYGPEILVIAPVRSTAQVDLKNLTEIPKEIIINEAAAARIDAKIAAPELVDLQTIMDQVQATMQSSIKTLQLQGYGVEAIALRTGTPVETIKQIILSGYVPPAGLSRYSSTSDIEQALLMQKRSLALSTNMKKLEVKTQLDIMGKDKLSEDFAQWALLTSHSEIAQEMSKRFLNSDMKYLSKALLTNLQELVDTQLKTTFITSANQVLEAAGDLGPISTYIGKEAISLKNWAKKKFEEPIAASMKAVSHDLPAQIEFNTAMNIQASISGTRFYRARQFWQFAPESKLTAADRKAIMEMGEDEFAALEEGIVEAVQYRGREFRVVTNSVDSTIQQMQAYGDHLYELNNAYSKSIGKGSLPNIGFWRPTVNLADKEIAYAFNAVTRETTLLYARTPGELLELEAQYMAHLTKTLEPTSLSNIRIVHKSDQEYFNILAGRHDPVYMEMADLGKFHSGASAATIVKTDASLMQEILGGYDYYLNRNVDNLLSIQMAPIMDHLKRISDISQVGYNAQKGNILSKLGNKPKDPGMILRNILLGYPNLNQHKSWAEWQSRLEVGTDSVLKTMAEVFNPILGPVTNKITGKSPRTAAEWEAIEKSAEARGISWPFEGVDKSLGLMRYLEEGKGEFVKPTAKAIVLSNAVAATALLRFLEVAQPLTNALSLPILTSAAVHRKMGASFLGAELNPNAKFTVNRIMLDGIRMLNSPSGKKWLTKGEEKGWFATELRNVSELQEQVRAVTPGMMSTIEEGLESNFIRITSKGSDYSEELVRKVAFSTGVTMAKEAYPGLDDVGVMIYARTFMDEVVGNYTAAQRPAAFQGTFGVGLGLFQTYMLTMAQAMYRQVSGRQWKSLGKTMLTQGTIFGAASLPGFHLVSEAIATNFSDENIDLETGTFRAIEDKTANLLLYGLPSMLGPGITTRGELNPRFPNPIQGLNSVAAVNLTGQVYNSMERIAKAAYYADEHAGVALLEAISLQSVSRPLARISELMTGSSLTGAGNVVASNEEIWNTQSIIARLMSTRPLAEIKLRQTMLKDTLYNAADREKRQGVTRRLKAHIRSGDMDSETLSNYADSYMRTGTASGWNAAVNEALIQEATLGSETVRRKLGPENPLHYMINDL
jgi:hypothetical protein